MALGEEDFGIYSLVAGMLSMLMFLNITMASSTQRFLSYALGKKDIKMLEDTFYYSCLIHLAIGVFIVLIIETGGRMFLENILQVPEGKESLALFVLHCLSISTFFTVISVPYNASLFTHENIIYVTIVQFLESIAKFCIAYYLLDYSGNRLKLYAILMSAIPIISAFLYFAYCFSHFPETQIQFKNSHNKSILKKITSYSGWNLIGGISSLMRTQGVAMLLNSFFGIIVNTAYGIANQVNGQLKFFTQAIVVAVRPQIVKSEGAGNRKRMLLLSQTTCKITFLLLSLISVPLIVEMPYILELWLKNVPIYAIEFTKLIIFISLLSQLSVGISISIESIGNIKWLQLLVGGMHFIVLPIGYVLLRNGLSPMSVFWVVIIEEFLGLVTRTIISQRLTGLNAIKYFTTIVAPCILLLFASIYSATYIMDYLPTGFTQFVVITLFTTTLIGIGSYTFILNNQEQSYIKSIIQKVWQKYIYKYSL